MYLGKFTCCVSQHADLKRKKDRRYKVTQRIQNIFSVKTIIKITTCGKNLTGCLCFCLFLIAHTCIITKWGMIVRVSVVPEKDYLRWHWLTFQQPEWKSSSESSDLCNVSGWYKYSGRLCDDSVDQSHHDHNSFIPSSGTNHLTLMMTSTQVVEASVNVTLNSPFQNYTLPDNCASLFSLSYDLTSGLKPFYDFS